MKPIILIHLKKFTRFPGQSICQFIISPLIYFIYGILIPLYFDEFFQIISSTSFKNSFLSVNLLKKNPEFIPKDLLTTSSIAIISKNESIKNSLSDYSLDYFNIEKQQVLNFNTIKEFSNFIYSENYSKSIYNLYIGIEADYKNEIFNFNFLNPNFTQDSIYYSSNLLEISYNNISKLNSFNKIKNFTLFQNFLLMYLKDNFIKKDFNIQMNSQHFFYDEINSQTDTIKNNYVNEKKIIIFIFSFIYIQFFVIFYLWIVNEKSVGLDNYLFQQGVSLKTYYFSWFFIYLIPTSISSVIIIIIFKYFYFSNLNILFLIIINFLQIFQIFSIIMIFVSVTKDIQTANSYMKIYNFLLMGLNIVFLSDFLPVSFKYLIMIFPSINFSANLLCIFDFNNFKKIPFRFLFFDNSNGINFFMTNFLSLIYIIILLLISSYLIRKKNSKLNLLNLFKKKLKENFENIYVNLKSEEINTNKSNIIENENSEEKIQKYENKNEFIEIHHEELTNTNKNYLSLNNCLKIQNLTKKFSNLIAVNNVSLNLFPSEIFVLLGHNGAGKTTLIKVLSGLELQNSGEIYLNGINLKNNLDYLYKNIGLCYQENVFFDYLTVKEHLIYLSEIKGSNNLEEINRLLENLQMKEKENSIIKTLSGGQMRKLAVALSLVGNRKLILLDEPTSGVDIVTRRDLWNFLKNYKKDKIIILTTHSLEEAEFLADRIGIMLEGKYVCSGTSNYLKNNYPCGFNLNLIINSKFNNDCKNKIFEFIKQFDNSVNIKIFSKGILSFNLNEKKNINKIFDFIEENKNNFGIDDFTISSTSLEDVFININSKELFNNENQQQNENIFDEKKNNFINEVKANFIKNLKIFYRNKSSFFLEIIFSCLFIFVFIFGLSNEDKNIKYTNVNQLLYLTDIFYKDYDNYILNSYFYDKKIKFKEIKYDYNNFQDFRKKFYESSQYNYERTAFYLDKNNETFNIFILYQPNSPDYYLIVSNYIISTILERNFNIKINFSKYSLIPLGSKQPEMQKLLSQTSYLMGIFMVFNTFLILSSYSLSYPLKEKINNIKEILYLGGSNMIAYWLGMLLVDIIKFFILSLILFSILIIYDRVYFAVWIISFFLYIPLIIYVYNFTFFGVSEEDGQKNYILFNNLFYLLFFYVNLIYYVVFDTDSFTILLTHNDVPFTFCDINPLSSLFWAYYRIFFAVILNLNVYTLAFNYYKLFFIEIIINCVLLYLNEMKISSYFFNQLCLYKFKKLPTKGIKDNVIDDYSNPILLSEIENNDNNNINNEIENVENNNINENDSNKELILSDYLSKSVAEQTQKINLSSMTTKIIGLTKSFWVCKGPNIRAVDKIYLGLEANEKFGLLGFNGSGKTTTFKSIINEFYYDSGEVELFNKKVSKDFEEIRKEIGYCPQNNILFENLTVQETFEFYMKMKNINKIYFERILNQFGMIQYKNTICKNLSGGNKRKLSFAIALMNNPKILLLDEPSTGVDPESRRIMWKNINDISKKGKEYNMILSTHSMEEAEILCDTISWLKEGSFIYIGNPEKLKIQYSGGYILNIKFKEENEIVENDDNFDYNKYIKGFNKLVEYRNTNRNVNLSEFKKFVVDLYEFCDLIELKEIKKNLTFVLFIKIKENKKKDLFNIILNMKDNNDKILEISINLESLDNILTSFN